MPDSHKMQLGFWGGDMQPLQERIEHAGLVGETNVLQLDLRPGNISALCGFSGDLNKSFHGFFSLCV
jgi:hypothetical protein